MKIKKITFHNYRCFKEGSISFHENEADQKNINLILGPNGGGKTELLFSFVWVLYDFDFRSLKGKEATPYPLNSDLYRRLQDSRPGSKVDCWIELVVEDEGVTYYVKRTVVFTKSGNSIEQHISQVLSHEYPNHERSLPITSKKEIELILGRIIPQSTLEGLVFDGERMQKLSRMDNDSKTVIRGVIRDVSNMELLEMSIRRFRDSRSAVTRRFHQSGATRARAEEQLRQLEERQEKAEKEIESLTPALEDARENQRAITDRLEQIDKELEKGRVSRELVKERRAAEQTRRTAQRDQAEDYSDLATALNEGYLLFADCLFADVETEIESTDVPDGLMAGSIESILQGDTCICGEPLDDKHRAHLIELLKALPPNNINSTLESMVRSLRMSANDARGRAKSIMGRIKKQEDRIAEAEETIRRISKQLTGSEDEDVSGLEEEKIELTKEQAKYDMFIPRAERKIVEARRTVNSCAEKRRELAKKNVELQSVESQVEFYDKAIKALERIVRQREEEALKTISSKLADAYAQISEDSALGRRICLGRFAPKTKYQIIVYNESNYQRVYLTLMESGTIERWRKDMSEEEVVERVILRCQESNSTGQNKINTLAFVKAILDYSNEVKAESSFEVRKVYPLLIDAPFGDIFEENLLLSSSLLHTFSEQVILMLADESYRSVEAQLSPNVSHITTLKKLPGKNESAVIDGRS